jgi:two-component system cell cycle sensor histidine kinase/response regulator CckA
MGSGTDTRSREPRPPVSAEDVLESITDAFAALDGGWRFTYLNAAAERLLRRGRAELLGREVWAEYPVLKDTPVERECRLALAEGTPAGFEHCLGSRCFEFRAFPARAGGLYVYVREITDRKRAAAKLRRSREEAERRLAELENIYRTAPIGMLLVDTDLRYVRINERLAAMNGVPAADHIGRTLWEVVPGIADAVAPIYLQVIATGEPIIDHEVRGSTLADPCVEHTYLCSYYPVKNPQGRMIGVTAIVRDITDQKRAEEDLRLAAQRFAVALKSSSIAVFNQDRDLRYTWLWNEHPEHYHQAILGKTDLEIKACEASERLTALKRRVLETGVGERHEITLPLFGEERVYALTLEPLRDERGGVVGITGAAINITERKRTEEALAASEERFRRIVETAAEGIMIQDAQGRITFANRRLAKLLGRPLPELLGRPSFDYLHQDDVERGRRSFESRKSGDSAVRDFRFRRPDGATVWCSIAGSTLRGDRGEFLGVLGMVTDITERKRADMALRENEIHMRLALDAGHMGTWDSDLLTGEIRWSDRHFTALGLEPGCFKPNAARFMECVHPDDRPAVARELQRSRLERRLFAAEFRVVWPDRSVHWIEARGQYTYDTQGKPVRMRGVIADVTERKHTEEALRHRQKLEGVGLLAGGIAHDFNNLLAGILGGASYALDVLPEDHPATPMLKVVEQASERAALLTRQLLAYSGRGQFVLDKLDLGDLVRETCELIRASIPKTVAIVTHRAPDLPPIVGDPGQMQQLIMNLLINAGEAIGEGNHGAVTVRTGCELVDADRIQAHFRAYEIPPGRYVVLEVADNGAGMDQATLSRIFDPFFTTKFTGRGLGLAAAQGIVRGHHGALEVESAPGSGTTFRVLLPVAAADPDPAPPEESAGDRVAKHAGAVLLVDDEDLVRRTVASALERDGFAVLQASSGVEAIRIFSERASEVALVVLDMSMPGMAGPEVLRELRVWRPEFPVLVYSGYSEGEVTRHFHGLPISGVLRKPFTARELTHRVRTILAASPGA